MSDLIDKHLRALRAETSSVATPRDREYWLRRLDRDLRRTGSPGIEEASTDELLGWLGNPRWSSKTRETVWCHLVAFYRQVTSGRTPSLDWDPSAEIRRPRVGYRPPRVAPDDQLQSALAKLDQPALRAVILAAGVGMRAGEAARAERCHFTRERVVILGKGDKVRQVPMTDDVWSEVGDETTGPIITDPAGAPVDASWVTRMVERALNRIGLPRLTLHWFRGAYATRLRRSGVDTLAISRLLGHSSVATTQKYVELDDWDLDAAVAKLPPLTRSPRAARAS